ncbi:MAG: hypothetical protein PHS17_07045 [Desulfobacterales bacterium]|nr:hypothetical protein [Desulfobacterales bacterium]
MGRPGLCLDENTACSDLPDDLILFISEDTSESRLRVYDLIMGVLNLGSGYDFEELPSKRLMPLLDVYFMIMDLVRFECMKRIGWVDAVPYADMPIIDLIVKKAGGDGPVLLKISSVKKSHPAFAEFMESNDLDRQTVVRKHAKEAIQILREKTQRTCWS